MAQEQLVETVVIGAYQYPVVALAGSAGAAVVPTPGAVALIDAPSISSATGSSQTVAAASATRQVLNISNNSAVSWWLNETGGTAAASGTGCFELRTGDRWTPRPAPTNLVTGIATAGSKLTVVVG